jgi:hypothetical protein
MAAVTDVVERPTGNLGIQIITCVASDTETFVSRFKTAVGAIANSESRAGSYCSTSGGTVTYNCTSASDDVVTIIISGY